MSRTGLRAFWLMKGRGSEYKDCSHGRCSIQNLASVEPLECACSSPPIPPCIHSIPKTGVAATAHNSQSSGRCAGFRGPLGSDSEGPCCNIYYLVYALYVRYSILWYYVLIAKYYMLHTMFYILHTTNIYIYI